MSLRPTLSLADLESFDPQAPLGARRRFCCPLCGEGKPKDAAHRCLSVETQSGLWNCFRCETSGKLHEHWTATPQKRHARSRSALVRNFTLPVPQPVSFSPAEKPVKAWQDHLHDLQALPETKGALYLENRGISCDVAVAAGVKFHPRWLGRPAVVFPIRDEHEGLVAAQGRYIDGRNDPKARTVGPKKEGVFLTSNFWDEVRRGAPIILTEAPIDALSLAVCGFPALALCGKDGIPPWLVRRCAFCKVFVAFDADDAGDQAFEKSSPLLVSFGVKAVRLRPENDKDWNAELCFMKKQALSDWLVYKISVF